jgi:hypothetical protein
LIRGETISQIYPVVLRQILERGTNVAPRGLPTIEVLGCQLRLERPRARVLHATGRIINPAFAVAEAVWILSGSDEPWIYHCRVGGGGRHAGPLPPPALPNRSCSFPASGSHWT